MKLNKRVFALFTAILMTANAAYSQQGKTYKSAEATLHILISDRGTKMTSKMPEGMEAISDQIKRRFNAENLVWLDSYFGRLVIGGSGEFKSSIKFQSGGGTISDGFLDWRIIELGSSAEQTFNASSFRFNLRAMPTMRPDNDQTKPPGLISYESVGISLNGISLPENKPQLLGTTNLPDGVGKLFFVLTVKNTN